jgi:hypothetical protein
MSSGLKILSPRFPEVVDGVYLISDSGSGSGFCTVDAFVKELVVIRFAVADVG